MRKVAYALSLLVFLSALIPAFTQTTDVNYADQNSWSQTCTGGSNQSPINIVRADNMCEGSSETFLNGFSDSQGNLQVTLPTAASNLIWLNPLNAALLATVSPNPRIDLDGDSAAGEDSHVPVTIDYGVIHKGSEHTLSGKQYPFELQFYGNMTTNRGDKYPVAFSYFIDQDDNAGTVKTSFINDILTKTGSGVVNTYTVAGYPGFSNYFNQFYFQYNQNFNRNTKFYMYKGSQTFGQCSPTYWFVFDKPMFFSSNDIQKLGSNFVGTTNSTRKQFDLGGREIEATGCWSADFFQNPVRYNYGFWFCIGFVLFYFFCTLYAEKELQIVDETYRDNAWTLHPLYSTWNVGGEYYSKGSRLLLLWMTIMCQVTVSAVLSANISTLTDDNGNFKYPLKDGYFIPWAIAGIICSWFTNYIFGCLITRVYALQRKRYVDKVGGEIEIEVNTAWFVFYFPAYVFMAVCVVITAWQNSYLETGPNSGAWWLLSTIVGAAIDLIILDVLIVLLAKCANPLKNWFKYRGFWFDYDLYLEYKKQD